MTPAKATREPTKKVNCILSPRNMINKAINNIKAAIAANTGDRLKIIPASTIEIKSRKVFYYIMSISKFCNQLHYLPIRTNKTIGKLSTPLLSTLLD